MNILLTSAGRRVSLLRSLQQDLRATISSQAKVYCTDLQPHLSAACHLSDGAFAVGRFQDAAYMPELLKLCKSLDVRLVIPTLDPELELYAKWKVKFEAEGIALIVSSEKFVSFCNDKRYTNQLFKNSSIATAPEVDPHNPTFPLFVRPIYGSSGKDIHLITSAADFPNHLKNASNYIYNVFLNPKTHSEFTIDLYYNRNHELRCVVPRKRLVVRGGEVSKGVTQKHPLHDYVWERLSHWEGAVGCITMQVFVSDEDQRVLGIEVNPRFGGGFPLSYRAGAKYTQWLIEEHMLNSEIPKFTDWEDQLTMVRYDSELFLSDVATGA